MCSYLLSIDGGGVDFAGENLGGIYLDADWRGFFCEKKLVVVKWWILAGIVDFDVVNRWLVCGEMRGQCGREAVTFCGGESGTGF
jgi:hypothetical protein